MASDIVGPPTPTTERDQATFLETSIGQVFVDPATAAAVRAWLADALPLDPGARVRTSIEGVPVVLERGAGGYSIVLGDLGAGPQAVPSS